MRRFRADGQKPTSRKKEKGWNVLLHAADEDV
jgi:hypothetical protein